MQSTRKARACGSVVVAVLAVLAVGFTVDVSAGNAPGSPRRGGNIVIGYDLEPACLNPLLGCGNTFATSLVVNPVLLGAFQITPTYGYKPTLVDTVEVTETPFTLTYHIRPEACWSDGTPVTSDDFIFTLETIMDEANDIVSRLGYEGIENAVRLSDKSVRFEFATPFAAWRELFGLILPRHALLGEDFNQAFLTGVRNPKTGDPIGSGPFLVASRAPGRSLRLARNPRWWGGQGEPYLSTVEFRFMPIADQIAGLRDGTIDLVLPQPTPLLIPLMNEPGLVVEWDPSRNMEHIDFRVDSPTMPLLAQTWFRQAVAYALDRDAVAEAVFGPLNVSLEPAQNLFYSDVQPEYVPSFAGYAYSTAKVEEIMTAPDENGVPRCAMGADGIWVCGGTRASVKLATVAGNALRKLAQDMFVEQAKAAGIEIVPDNSPPWVLFGDEQDPGRLATSDFEAVMFTWLRGADVGGGSELYGCHGTQNFMNYCAPPDDPSKDVTQILIDSDSTIDPGDRAALVNKADALLAHDAPTLPLFNRPAFLAYRARIHGVVNNPSAQGPLWNIEEWWLESEGR